ncbi:MAG: carbon-nitrogen hydrolase, partial [Propionibacteriales bacterium]|nr:carbon-nitrogen hydrolase [Propionibacteriales bacterium]
MTIVDVVVLQLAVTTGDVDGNVDRVVHAVREHGGTADLVVAPELVTTGYDLDLLRSKGKQLAEPLDGPSVRRLVAAAVEAEVTLVAGFLEASDGQVYDALVTVTPDGSATSYRKTHLYPPELDCFASGTTLGPVATPAGTLGPLICFEHAFPEVATTLALAGAEILVIPSAVPDGYEHLLALRTRARGQDNQIFAIGCNLAGNGFCGRSLVSDPRGEVLAEAGAEETVLHA